MAADESVSEVSECEVVEDGISIEDELVSKRNTKAYIWKYFGFQCDDKGKPRWKDHLKRHLCRVEIAAKDGNTTPRLFGV